jgi:hypothetical protein
VIRRTCQGRWEVRLYYGVYVFDSYWDAFRFKVQKSLEGWL